MNRILPIDYGSKRIGLAISDVLKIIAKPLKTIHNISDQDVIKEILDISKTLSIDKIIVGLPLTMKGKYSEQTNKVLSFINLLKENINIAVESYDERLSSIEAKRSLVMQGVKTGHNKSEVDKTAAAIFLQGYLNSHATKK